MTLEIGAGAKLAGERCFFSTEELDHIRWWSSRSNAFVHAVGYSYFEKGFRGATGVWVMMECNYCLGQIYFDGVERRFRCSECTALDHGDKWILEAWW